MTVVEGPNVIAEALRSPAEIVWAAIGEEYAGTPEGWEIASRARERGATAVLAPDAEVRELCATDSPRPALAIVKTPPLQPRPLFPGRYLVADGVQAPGNLGTLVRSAWAFGLDGVAIGEGTVDPWNPKVVRASAGGVFRVPLLGVPPDFPAEEESKMAEPRSLLYADPSGAPLDWTDTPLEASVPSDSTAAPLDSTAAPPDSTAALLDSTGALGPAKSPGPNWALVVGNEVRGVSERYRRFGRATAVPLAPGVDSLNVAVAGSILMYVLSQPHLASPERRGATSSQMASQGASGPL